jgi:hypothetical protein
MHDDALPPEQRAALHALAPSSHQGFYLANTLWFDVNGVPTSLMSFPYPNITPPEPGLGVTVASLEDIAAMKIEAIASRGARKDFVDLICKEGLGVGGRWPCSSDASPA